MVELNFFRESREAPLVDLPDRLTIVTLEPLTRSTAATLEELANEVARIAEAEKHA